MIFTLRKKSFLLVRFPGQFTKDNCQQQNVSYWRVQSGLESGGHQSSVTISQFPDEFGRVSQTLITHKP
jgi:hypothetical protein